MTDTAIDFLEFFPEHKTPRRKSRGAESDELTLEPFLLHLGSNVSNDLYTKLENLIETESRYDEAIAETCVDGQIRQVVAAPTYVRIADALMERSVIAFVCGGLALAGFVSALWQGTWIPGLFWAGVVGLLIGAAESDRLRK